MRERPNRTVSKTVEPPGSVGSNPTPSAGQGHLFSWLNDALDGADVLYLHVGDRATAVDFDESPRAMPFASMQAVSWLA
jgi:hypothetical protein